MTVLTGDHGDRGDNHAAARGDAPGPRPGRRACAVMLAAKAVVTVAAVVLARDHVIDGLRWITVRFLHWIPARFEYQTIALLTDIQVTIAERAAVAAGVIVTLGVVLLAGRASARRLLTALAVWAVLATAAAWMAPGVGGAPGFGPVQATQPAMASHLLPAAIAAWMALDWLAARRAERRAGRLSRALLAVPGAEFVLPTTAARVVLDGGAPVVARGCRWVSVLLAAGVAAVAWRGTLQDNDLARRAGDAAVDRPEGGLRVLARGNAYTVITDGSATRPAAAWASLLDRSTFVQFASAPPGGPLTVRQELHIDSHEFEDAMPDAARRHAWHFTPTDERLLTIDLERMHVDSDAAIARGRTATQCSTRVVENPVGPGLILFKELDSDALVVVDGAVTRHVNVGLNLANATASRATGCVYWTLMAGVAKLAVLDCRTWQVSLHDLPSTAADLVLLDDRGHLYLSLPARGEVLALKLPDLTEFRRLPAPAGVRALALDPVAAVYLGGSSLTGMVEVRNLGDLAIRQRVRVAPWLRKAAIIPGQARAVVTSIAGVFEVSW